MNKSWDLYHLNNEFNQLKRSKEMWPHYLIWKKNYDKYPNTSIRIGSESKLLSPQIKYYKSYGTSFP